MESRSGRPLFLLRPRPITLGEILRRAGGYDDLMPPPRPMARIMSPARLLGPLASGRPRRPRTLNRPSASAGNTEDETRPRRRRALLSTSASARRRSAVADARIQRFYRMMSRSHQIRRSGNSRTRIRQNVGTGSPDLFSFGFHRNNTAGNRQAHSWSRSNTNAGPRSGPVRIQRAVMSRPSLSSSSYSRMLDVNETQVFPRAIPFRSSFMTPRNTSRHRVGRSATGEARRNNTNERSGVELSSPVRRFIDYAAEFIPLHPHPPDAEPPEWSLDVTPADFGPFAIGRSAVSRYRSLAMIAAFSQIVEEDNIDV